jgi:hypothetical protein
MTANNILNMHYIGLRNILTTIIKLNKNIEPKIKNELTNSVNEICFQCHGNELLNHIVKLENRIEKLELLQKNGTSRYGYESKYAMSNDNSKIYMYKK